MIVNDKQMGVVEKRINYTFKDKTKLLTALTHSSYANELKQESVTSNERLEFLGDSVLSVIISEYIYTNFNALSEGHMTKLRASVVCEPSLAMCAREIELDKYLFLGKGEKLSNGGKRPSILSDAFEALLGSIYIDGGFEAAKQFVFHNVLRLVENTINGSNNKFVDYKTMLQEDIQKNKEVQISYEIIKEEGPDHKKTFCAQVKIAGKVKGIGRGKSKKEAQQNAAKDALDKKHQE